MGTRTLQRFIKALDTFSERAGKIASYLVFIMMAFTATEVISRYVFNHPTFWVWPINRQIFGVFILFAGIYATLKQEHIRIEIVYDHLPARLKAVARGISMLALICFIGVLIWQGSWMGMNSLKMSEKAAGAFRIPLWPLKLLIPAISVVFLLQGIAGFFRREDD